ncbi:MAG: DUF5688 family protein [Lachnospiraceae bacterium]|nr:DUF5688 family protein [Lachnospiraceae bacterium]
MSIKEERIVKRCGEELKGILIKEVEIEKNNNQVLRGLGISRPGSNVKMMVYWDDIERYYGKNYTEEQALKYISEMVQEHMDIPLLYHNIQNYIQDWDWARRLVCKKVVNYEKNQERLEGFPHRRYLDLAELYYLQFSMPDGRTAATEVPLNLMDYWGVTLEELEQHARKNMDTQGYYLKLMETILAEHGVSEPGEIVPIYVLSSKKNKLGAAAITNPELLGRLTEGMEGDFYILPSSVHELLLLPVDKAETNVRGLREIVQCMNQRTVSEGEFLSDNVYRYKSGDALVEICE